MHGGICWLCSEEIIASAFSYNGCLFFLFSFFHSVYLHNGMEQMFVAKLRLHRHNRR